jgi:hypothetical protein
LYIIMPGRFRLAVSGWYFGGLVMPSSRSTDLSVPDSGGDGLCGNMAFFPEGGYGTASRLTLAHMLGAWHACMPATSA